MKVRCEPWACDVTCNGVDFFYSAEKQGNGEWNISKGDCSCGTKPCLQKGRLNLVTNIDPLGHLTVLPVHVCSA